MTDIDVCHIPVLVGFLALGGLRWCLRLHFQFSTYVVVLDVLTFLFFLSYSSAIDFLAFLRIWPFNERTGIPLFMWDSMMLLVKSFQFSSILSLICPSCKAINFMGNKPCEHSLLTGTNREVINPSGDMWPLVSHDGLTLTSGCLFKKSLKPCGATGANSQVWEVLIIRSFLPF